MAETWGRSGSPSQLLLNLLLPAVGLTPDTDCGRESSMQTLNPCTPAASLLDSPLIQSMRATHWKMRSSASNSCC
jgi:hypothetical protein